MTQWWDVSSDAGPKAREAHSFPEGIPELETLNVVDNELKYPGFHSSGFG